MSREELVEENKEKSTRDSLTKAKINAIHSPEKISEKFATHGYEYTTELDGKGLTLNIFLKLAQWATRTSKKE